MPLQLPRCCKLILLGFACCWIEVSRKYSFLYSLGLVTRLGIGHSRKCDTSMQWYVCSFHSNINRYIVLGAEYSESSCLILFGKRCVMVPPSHSFDHEPRQNDTYSISNVFIIYTSTLYKALISDYNIVLRLLGKSIWLRTVPSQPLQRQRLQAVHVFC